MLVVERRSEYAGRGLNPRPERSTPAKYPPATPNPARFPLRESSCFLAFIQCPCVDGSFRSGVQPTTGTRSERYTHAKYPPVTPNPARPPSCKSFCFLAFIQCPCVGGSFRSGVQPPTGIHRSAQGRNDTPTLNIRLQLQIRQGLPRVNLSVFWHPSNALAGVDRSGRGCNPRPARSRASRDESFFSASEMW